MVIAAERLSVSVVVSIDFLAVLLLQQLNATATESALEIHSVCISLVLLYHFFNQLDLVSSYRL